MADPVARSRTALLLARGLPALAVGLATTFTGGHSAAFGLIAVGLWGVVSGIAEGLLLLRFPPARWRVLALFRATVAAASGVVALAATATGAPAALVYIVGVGALGWGALDLASGLSAREVTPLAREFMLQGGITLLLGVIAILVPPGYTQTFAGAGHPGLLSAATTVVGFFGAWGIVIGVLSLIASVGQRSATAAAQ